MLVDQNYFVLKVLFIRFYETSPYIKWIKRDAQRAFYFPPWPNSFVLSPAQIWKPESRPLSIDDGSGNTFVSEVLGRYSSGELMLSVWCYVHVSVCSLGGAKLDRRTVGTCGKFCLIFLPEKVEMFPISRTPCPRCQSLKLLSNTLGKYPWGQCNMT